jgi:hypothetical protein
MHALVDNAAQDRYALWVLVPLSFPLPCGVRRFDCAYYRSLLSLALCCFYYSLLLSLTPPNQSCLHHLGPAISRPKLFDSVQPPEL